MGSIFPLSSAAMTRRKGSFVSTDAKVCQHGTVLELVTPVQESDQVTIGVTSHSIRIPQFSELI